VRPIRHNVIRPDVMASGGPQLEARPIGAPEPGSRGLLLRHVEAFLPPDRLHAILPHVPPLLPHQIRDRAIPIPPLLLGERDDPFAHRLLTRVPPWPIPIGGPKLADRPTRSPLGHVEHGDGMPHGFAPAGRA
jgi:hypothetical protein